MARNDLDVRVKLGVESKEFRDALRRANAEAKEFKKQQTNAYKGASKGASDGFGSIISFAKKMAPAVSAGAAALAVAKKAMQENQTLTDEWARITASATSTYEGFVSALVEGNLSGFFSNMDNIISKAREAADAIDALETAQLFNSREMARLSMEQEKHLSILRNKGISKEQRAESEAALKDIFTQMDEETKRMSNYRFEAFAKRFADIMTAKGVNTNWEDIITRNKAGDYELTTNSAYQTYFGTLSDYEAAVARRDEMKQAMWNREVVLIGMGYNKMTAKKYAAKEFPEFNELNAAVEVSDEKIRELYNQLISAYNDRAQYYRNVGRANRYLNAGAGGKGGGVQEAPPEGSIAWVDQQINEWSKKMSLATTAAGIAAAQAMVDELKAQKDSMVKAAATNEIKPLSTTGVNFSLGPVATMPTDNSGISIGKAAAKNKKFKLTTEEVEKGMEQLNTVFMQTSSIVSAISSEGLKANQVIGTIMSVIGQIIGGPYGAALSGLGNLIGAFDTGGIVGGTSFKGDRLTANVSSGEMILNRQQQRNLFGMLQGGGSPATVTTVGVKGEDVYIALSNYMRRTNKVL